MPIDQTTPNRAYPLPHSDNTLAHDVERLRQAFNSLDVDVRDLVIALGLKAAVAHTHAMSDISGLDLALAGKMSIGSAFALNDLSDVDTSSSELGHILGRGGVGWIPIGFTWGNLGSKPTTFNDAGLTGGTLSDPVTGPNFSLDTGAAWKLVGSTPTLNYDAGDYESFDRTSNIKQLTIGATAYFAWAPTYFYHRHSDNGAGAGPNIYYDRASTSPAVNDDLAAVFFQGRNSTQEVIDYASVRAQIVGPTDGTEAGRLVFRTVIAGAVAARFYLGEGLYAASLTDPGAGKANFAGVQIGGTPIGSNAYGNRTVSTSAPSGGADGDIWLQV